MYVHKCLRVTCAAPWQNERLGIKTPGVPATPEALNVQMDGARKKVLRD